MNIYGLKCQKSSFVHHFPEFCAIIMIPEGGSVAKNCVSVLWFGSFSLPLPFECKNKHYPYIKNNEREREYTGNQIRP